MVSDFATREWVLYEVVDSMQNTNARPVTFANLPPKAVWKVVTYYCPTTTTGADSVLLRINNDSANTYTYTYYTGAAVANTSGTGFVIGQTQNNAGTDFYALFAETIVFNAGLFGLPFLSQIIYCNGHAKNQQMSLGGGWNAGGAAPPVINRLDVSTANSHKYKVMLYYSEVF